ncbi:MAG: hypothetical protein M1531_02295 [Chloroflexi bacterium]|nr:hypothetical protein [Chloroflexota bacterium]
MAARRGGQTNGFVVLTLAFRREGHLWSGECLELGTATDGRSLEKTKQELIELVQLHLNALEEAGEREYFFRKHDIKFYTDATPPNEILCSLPVVKGSFLSTEQFPIPA